MSSGFVQNTFVDQQPQDKFHLASVSLSENLCKIEVLGGDFPEVEGGTVIDRHVIREVFTILNS